MFQLQIGTSSPFAGSAFFSLGIILAILLVKIFIVIENLSQILLFIMVPKLKCLCKRIIGVFAV